ncbi:hypothetical protein ACSSVY_001800 [Roseovarius sp. MBR-51]
MRGFVAQGDGGHLIVLKTALVLETIRAHRYAEGVAIVHAKMVGHAVRFCGMVVVAVACRRVVAGSHVVTGCRVVACAVIVVACRMVFGFDRAVVVGMVFGFVVTGMIGGDRARERQKRQTESTGGRGAKGFSDLGHFKSPSRK